MKMVMKTIMTIVIMMMIDVFVPNGNDIQDYRNDLLMAMYERMEIMTIFLFRKYNDNFEHCVTGASGSTVGTFSGLTGPQTNNLRI